MASFTLITPPDIRFGRGCRTEAAEVILSHGRRVVLVRGRSCAWVDTLTSRLTGAGATVLAIHSDGEPTLPQLDAALETARASSADVVVAVGGGATIDLGKAIAGLLASPHPPLAHLEGVGEGRPIEAEVCPFIAIPTTAGTGAEATKNAVLAVPDAGVKVSLRDARMIPSVAIVDPALTDNSPRALTLASGLDSITQLIEPYLSCRANPLTDSLCRDRIPPALNALRTLMAGEDADARDVMARASLTSGIVLANAGLGIVHGLAGVIGGRTGAAHGALCGRLLPAALKVNRAALAEAGVGTERVDEVLGWIGAAFPEGDPLTALEEFMASNGLPGLAAMGCLPEHHADVARRAAGASSTKANPIVLSEARIIEILARTA